jgi:hypothetical protein
VLHASISQNLTKSHKITTPCTAISSVEDQIETTLKEVGSDGIES